MTSFEMIKYHGQEYPADVPLRIKEIAAHFDITNVGGKLSRSYRLRVVQLWKLLI